MEDAKGGGGRKCMWNKGGERQQEKAGDMR